jgi:hypothetical protein
MKMSIQNKNLRPTKIKIITAIGYTAIAIRTQLTVSIGEKPEHLQNG